jgi:hypothetical protein
VTIAKRAETVQLPDESARQAAEEKYLNNLRELRAWYEEWSGVARVTIQRRDHLILLGLAHRRPRATGDDGGDDEGNGGGNA